MRPHLARDNSIILDQRAVLQFEEHCPVVLSDILDRSDPIGNQSEYPGAWIE